MKKKALLVPIMSIVLMSAMFSAIPVVEVQAASDNQVTLSDPTKDYYGVFLAGRGESKKPSRVKCQEEAFKKSRTAWADTLVTDGKGWNYSRMTGLGPNTTSAELEANITYYKTKLKAGDEFHFYFVGHGWEQFIALKDGSCPIGNIVNALSGFKRGVTISILLDCCDSHKMLEEFKKITADDGKKINPDHVAALGTTNSLVGIGGFFGYAFSYSWGTLGTFALIQAFKLLPKSTLYAKAVFNQTANCDELLLSEGDQDGDGLIDEDGGVLGDYDVPNSALGEDDDGDGSIDEDSPPQGGTYFADPPAGVGGIVIPVDKLALLAPYVGLASTILVATTATAIYVKRVKRRKEKQ